MSAGELAAGLCHTYVWLYVCVTQSGGCNALVSDAGLCNRKKSEVKDFQAQIQSLGTVLLEENLNSATTNMELSGFLDLSQTSNCLVNILCTCTSKVEARGVPASTHSV